MLIAASLCAFAVYRNLIAYILVSTLLPAVIGVFFRYQLAKSDVASTAAAFFSSIAMSALMMAYGSYFLTFLDPGQGFLIGSGWSSVLSATIFGTIAGAGGGLFYMVARASIELMADIRDSS